MEKEVKKLDMMEKEAKKKLDCLKRTIESLKKEKRKLKVEKEKLKKELEEERIARAKVQINWRKTKQEIIIEHRRDVALNSAMTGSVSVEKVDSAYQDGSNERGEEAWRNVEGEEVVEEEEED